LTEDQNNQTLETRYLLGKLTEAEEPRFEEHYFADEAAFEEIAIAEDELIDAYVRGQLSPDDRERFEKSLVSSERLVERVQFARVLSNSMSSGALPLVVEKHGRAWWRAIFAPSFTDRPAFRMALAAGGLAVLVGTVALVVERRQLRNESRLLDTERAALEQQKQELARRISDQQSRTDQLVAELQNERAARDKLNQELQVTRDQIAKTRQPPAVPAIASILLFPGLSRGADERNELVVPAGAATIQLKLALDTDDYNRYRISIRSADGREAWSQDQLRAQGPRPARIILSHIPSNRMMTGDYVVNVSGRTSSGSYDSVADYAFRLSKK
jgi:hypothetical protein